MYEVTRNVILSGSYELTGILAKIDTLWLQGSLTDAERLELIELARAKATPSNSFAPLQDQIDVLAARVKALEDKAQSTDPDTSADAWPAYVQPTGAHDAYCNGAQVTYNGSQYRCIAPDGVAVVWAPDVYPAYWQEVTE